MIRGSVVIRFVISPHATHLSRTATGWHEWSRNKQADRTTRDETDRVGISVHDIDS